jgi:signal transduction histidine kinase
VHGVAINPHKQELRDPLVSAQLAQIIMDDLQVVAVYADADLNIVAHAPELGTYLQAAQQDLVGASLLDLFPELVGSEDDLGAVVGGQAPRFDLPMINRMDPDGVDRCYISLSALPHAEAPDQLVLLVQDVTPEGRLDQQVMQQLNEVRLLRARLETANQELMRLDKEKSAFLRMAAHDLRAPLAVVKGYVELVLENTDVAGDEEAVKSLGVVLARTQQMTDLIDNLLDVEKIESGAANLDLRPVDLSALVEEMGRGFVPVAQQKGLELKWRVPVGLPNLMADRDRLVQVLNNLVSNAIKFTPAGAQVRIGVLKQDAQIILEVSDTGPGISEEDQARLFQRFFRTDASRQQRISGTGLGLSIVKAIVEQHGGQVYCRSKLGEGTTLGFSLPLKET